MYLKKFTKLFEDPKKFGKAYPYSKPSERRKEMRIRERWIVFIIGFVILFVNPISSSFGASTFPTRYIELIIPSAPGGVLDTVGRLFKDKVEKILGQPLVFISKPGAAGASGTLYAKGCKPDGYTLVIASASTMIIPPLIKKGARADYTMDDFTPICTVTYAPIIFCVRTDSPYKTMNDFIGAAKTKKMKYSTLGVFSSPHLGMEAFSITEGFQVTHIPYVGAANAMTALLGGHVDMSASAPTGMEEQMRILAVADEKRWNIHPEVPTLKDLGYSISIPPSYFSLWAPKGVPQENVDRIYEAYKKAFEENKEEITKRANAANQTVFLKNSDELTKIYRYTSDFYKKMIDKIGAPTK